MTRINANIDPADLIDQHLLAEYRELVRIPNAVLKKQLSGQRIDSAKLPQDFRLGSGHVLFFYNKNAFLHRRFLALKQELSKRGIVNQMDDAMFTKLDAQYYQDIDDHELEAANRLVAERICERVADMKRPPTLNREIQDKDKYQQFLLGRYV